MILRTSGIGVSIVFLREAQWGSRGREFDSRHSDQKLHRRICSSVELFCLPTAWSENEKRMQNVVRLKNVRTGFL